MSNYCKECMDRQNRIEELEAELDEAKAAHRSCAETAIRIRWGHLRRIEELEKRKGGEETR